MSTKVEVQDKYFISKKLADMGEAEREMLRLRVIDTANALDSAITPEFAELVALAVLERRGLKSGTMEDAITNAPQTRKEEAKKSSIFARQVGISRRAE
ncbi:hypothetical protein EOA27_06050 [Mesorhizobium sp. M2A.F.Ca.ET.037.01.1.1]|uniref:hypothetical protein n=1 Tax=unclassified Mesorhizobium TaxID=325217 RepID=UPI000FCC3799|nr:MULTISPECIES: hypothetical protein [unclassified Mesorhizobium]RUX21436.1 hypothetical protein EOA27_06050 [Mesorhizobium sp. M2A.F.Ca.ET.037.01.1.1]RUY12196.1 hypothetical protein EOA25_03960 [Mesorhizobium sp. M2A.F.Ca.ET.040.01.1.1]RWA90960.1 MAG: hypothetical protein EOQ31_12225 [Mesorhizobium sp.]TIV19801.1 MAG: hypothetical protein E5V95_07165 [Mesorhizobium sp.]